MSTRGWSEQGGKIGGKNERAVVIALLVERSLPIPEVHSSNPVIRILDGNFSCVFVVEL